MAESPTARRALTAAFWGEATGNADRCAELAIEAVGRMTLEQVGELLREAGHPVAEVRAASSLMSGAQEGDVWGLLIERKPC
jgi:hypothetical protein